MEKMKLMKLKKIKTRSLTKNEKFLLIALGFVIFIWAIFSFVLTPQAEKLSILEADKMNFENQIIENTIALEKEKSIDDEWRELDSQRGVILSNYFPKLDQAQIIYLLNDLLEEDNVEISNINFSRPSMENFGDIQANQMSVSIPFTGEYDGVMSIIKALNNSPRKIALDRISMDQNGNLLSGNMELKIYSLEGIADVDPDIIYIDQASNDGISTPFPPYNEGDFVEDNLGGFPGDMDIDGEGNYVEDKSGKLLHDFELGYYNFIPSSPLVKGSAISSTNRKSGKYSLRLEYNILALEKENRAYIDISKPTIEFKIPPSSLGLWVNSYGYSPGTLAMTLKGQGGEKIEVDLVEGIRWMGWEYVETRLPEDLKLYPLSVENIYYETPYNSDEYGVLLLDKLQAFYPESGQDSQVLNNEINDFYVVKPGDNLTKISEEKYGTPAYKNEIMNLNDIKLGETLQVGKVLVLKRH